MIVAIYHHSADAILLADSDHPERAPLSVPIATARELAEAILGALAVPVVATAIAGDPQ